MRTTTKTQVQWGKKIKNKILQKPHVALFGSQRAPVPTQGVKVLPRHAPLFPKIILGFSANSPIARVIRATPHLFFVFAFLYTLTYLVTPGAQRAVASKPASANIHVGSITITTRPCTTGLMYVKSSVSILPLKNHTFTLDAFLPRHGCLSYA